MKKIDTDDINIDEYLSDDEYPSYKTQANNYSADDEDKQVPYAAGTSFHQSLNNQLTTYRIDEEERAIAEFLVGSIDDSGYILKESKFSPPLPLTNNSPPKKSSVPVSSVLALHC